MWISDVKHNGSIYLAIASAFGCTSPAQTPVPVAQIQIDTDRVIGHVEPKIYGQLLEHIYHSVNGGIWGDIVFDRSFEERLSNDPWSVGNREIISPAVPVKSSRFGIGSEAWRNFDATLELRKVGRAGTVAVGFRVAGKSGYVVQLGGSADAEQLLSSTRGSRDTDHVDQQEVASAAGGIQPNVWYTLRIRCEEKHAQIWLDGKLLFDEDLIDRPNGQLVLYAIEMNAVFRSVRASTLDGKPLLEETSSPARHWMMVGAAQATLDDRTPLNTRK